MLLVSVLRRIGGEHHDTVWMQRLCLAVLFLLGAVGGYAYAFFSAEQSASELSAYLESYCQLFSQGGNGAVSVFSAVRLYFGHLLLAFFFGFTALGIVVIPAVVGACGFSAMYAVACFAMVYGRDGVLLAMSALGVRLLFTLPCLLWLGAHAWSAASSLVRVGRGKRCAPVLYDGSYFYRFFVCIVLLLIGVFVERYVTPPLFHLALQTL